MIAFLRVNLAAGSPDDHPLPYSIPNIHRALGGAFLMVKPQAHDLLSLTPMEFLQGISSSPCNIHKNQRRQHEALAVNMRVPWIVFIDSGLLVLDVLAYASVIPRRDKPSTPDNSQRLASLPRHPSSQSSYTSQHMPLGPGNAIIKRDDEQGDPLRIRKIVIVSGSVPIAASAHSFEFFYNSILFQALAPWCFLPPQGALVMTMGPLQLTMTIVYNGGVPQGIPWAFVRNFARNMLAMTARGFTGTYDMYYSTDFGYSPLLPGLGVDVQLRILWGM